MIVHVINRSREQIAAGMVRRDITRLGALARRKRWAITYPAAVTVVAVSAMESRRLERRFLKRNRAANVLSFRYDGYGEIILTPAVIRAEARRVQEPYRDRLRRMAIHGFLHLLGCHHQGAAAAARRFEKRERELLSHLGLADTSAPR